MVNLAKNINSALPVLGIAFEVWDSYSKLQKQQEFENGKKVIISNLENQRDELRQKFDGENFVREFFPSFYTFDSELKSLNSEIEEKRRQQKAFAAWREEARVIEGEFRDLSE